MKKCEENNVSWNYHVGAYKIYLFLQQRLIKILKGFPHFPYIRYNKFSIII